MRSKPSPFVERNPALVQADVAADKALRWCLRKLRLKAVPLPIPVDVWIERPMGLTLTIMDIRKAYKIDDIEGNTIPARFEIEIDETLVDDDARFRFVCAHEVGHMLMHRDARRLFAERSHIPATLSNLQESQADRFAVSFLMPLQSMFDRLFQLADQQRTDHTKFIEVLMADSPHAESVWATKVLPDLHAAFGVGLGPVVARLASLRLRSGRPFLAAPVAARLRQRFETETRFHDRLPPVIGPVRRGFSRA